MPGMLWRILIAVICVVLFNLLLPPVLRLIGFSVEGDLLLVVRVIVAAFALFYIVWGRTWPGPPA